MGGKRQIIIRVLLFALLGLLMEVFFTAFGGLAHGDWNMRGHTSPWMMLDYGILGVVVYPISGWLIHRRVPLLLRAFVYMLGIFLVEYVSGEIFTAVGLRIWNYSHLPLNFRGQITLTYAPFWYALGLGLETLNRWVDACAAVLAGNTRPFPSTPGTASSE
ncbi:MAG TPA: hypothetical protein PK349_08080 [Candidatus Hydrogenedentes bacterium]|nr:hypothetical protein [Candidatus Hydrogenedentota bacterium]